MPQIYNTYSHTDKESYYEIFNHIFPRNITLNIYLDFLNIPYIYGARKTYEMENFTARKQSLQEEIAIAEWMLACEHRTDMRNRITVYINQIKRELLDSLI